jgi:indole-3-glycerol phosphate synthase
MTETPRIADILLRIVERRRRRVSAAAEVSGAPPTTAEGGSQPLLTPGTNLLLSSIAKRRGRAVIAEIKMGSPSLGSLEGRFDPLELAAIYAQGGAAALSVVVEPDFFYGSYDLLRSCRERSGLPALAKDFVVDPIQLQWARQAGADGILLVASLYTRDELRSYATAARRLGLVPLVEIHDLGDVSKLDHAGWEMVGVNNRNLRTFQVEVEHSLALASTLPSEAVKVAESGISTGKEIALLRNVGYDAFLVGEALLTSEDPGFKLQELRA